MIINKTELMVEINSTKHFIDLKEEASFTLNFNINDINNIENTNSSFSKTIVIPETNKNRFIFENISNINASTGFDPNKKSRAWLYVDSILVFDGYLQLKSINTNIFNDKTEYEIVLLSDNGTFFKNINEKFLTDLNFSELNHNWDKHNVIQSFTSKWSDGYYYPLIDYGYNWSLNDINGVNGNVKVGEMYPSTNVKYILDKIFSSNGFSYKSDFFESKMFKNLYIPFNGSDMYRESDSILGKFRVGINNQSTLSTRGVITIEPDKVFNAITGFVHDNIKDVDLGTFKVPFDDLNSPNGDPFSLYDSLTYEYVAPSNFAASRFVCDFDFTTEVSLNVDKRILNIPLNNICFKRSRNPLTGATVSGGVVIPCNGNPIPLSFTTADINNVEHLDKEDGTRIGFTNILNGYSYDIKVEKGPKRIKGQISTDMLDGSTPNRRKLYPGERVWVEIKLSQTNQQIRTQIGNSYLNPPTVSVSGQGSYNTSLNSYKLLNIIKGTQLYNIISDKISENELIEYNSVIPKNIKQKDFIKSLIYMFNLMIEPDKNNKNVLIIEPRDNFYKGEIKDWTNKLDINSDVNIQILAETQNKTLNFKYKDDKDFYNVSYKDNHNGLNYGELKYIIDNDFLKGEKKIELIFSPTPIVNVQNSYQFVIPKIGKVNNNVFSKTEHNIRILTRFTSSIDTKWTYNDYVYYGNTNSPYFGYISLTTNGFTNIVHPGYKAGDYININQADGGATKPMLQGNFKIVEVPDNRTIVIDITLGQVGSGPAINGVVTPLDGMLPTAKDLDTWNLDGTNLKAYPYLGHFDNPQDPSYDLNYGQTNGLWYMEDTVTNNNLYNNYWKNTCNELSDKDSRLITAMFLLTPNDIAEFSFRDTIFIRDAYYKVNKISEYNPTRTSLVKVELIKSLVQTIYKPFTKGRFEDREYTKDSVAVASPLDGKPNVKTNIITTRNMKNFTGRDATTIINQLTSNSTNNISSGDTLVVGRYNDVYNRLNNVTGDNNEIRSENNFVQGKDNIISNNSDNNFMFGNNNIIEPGVENSIVFGDNQRISIPNSFIVNTKFVKTVDEINACRDIILMPYSDKVESYISASRDSVTEQYTHDVVNHIDGGRY